VSQSNSGGRIIWLGEAELQTPLQAAELAEKVSVSPSTRKLWFESQADEPPASPLDTAVQTDRLLAFVNLKIQINRAPWCA